MAVRKTRKQLKSRKPKQRNPRHEVQDRLWDASFSTSAAERWATHNNAFPKAFVNAVAERKRDLRLLAEMASLKPEVLRELQIKAALKNPDRHGIPREITVNLVPTRSDPKGTKLFNQRRQLEVAAAKARIGEVTGSGTGFGPKGITGNDFSLRTTHVAHATKAVLKEAQHLGLKNVVVSGG